MKIKNTKGNILTENIIFIILNLVFITILILFIFSRISGASLLEEKYSKQISLMVDASEPGMTIYLNMEDALKTAKKNNVPVEGIVKIKGNLVTVDLRGKGGYSYSFFNGVKATANFDTEKKDAYFFFIR